MKSMSKSMITAYMWRAFWSHFDNKFEFDEGLLRLHFLGTYFELNPKMHLMWTLFVAHFL